MTELILFSLLLIFIPIQPRISPNHTMHRTVVNDCFCASVDGGDDLRVMSDNGTHPVQAHTSPHFLTLLCTAFGGGFYPARLQET